MFDSLRQSLRDAARERSRRRREHERQERERKLATDRARRMQEDMERRIKSVRVITGDVRYRYSILDTLRAHGYRVSEPSQDMAPTQATEAAIRSLQEQAVTLGADAVIHATFNILRYTAPRRGYAVATIYETHAFGTAIKVLGPPSDWEGAQGESEDEGT